MEISVNLIIIAGFERPQKGWGGGVGGVRMNRILDGSTSIF